MRNYSKAVSTQNTPQTQPIFGRTDMIQNNAGGFVFQITPQEQLERFLLLGTENGSYHAGEQKLTEDNAKSVISYIKTDGVKVVQTVVDTVVSRKAPKVDPALFVLALAATYGDAATKIAAYNAIKDVTKTATHLFTFLANIQNLRGWSRGLRNGVAKFYTSRTADQIAYQMVKYRNRAGFTHRDALRLSHAVAPNEEINKLFGYAVEKVKGFETGNKLIDAFTVLQDEKISNNLLIDIIGSEKVTWEMVPTEKLNEPEVLTALLEKMPLHALIRNLNRFSYTGLIKNKEVVQKIVSKLTNEDYVKKAGVHPVIVVNAMLTYSSGRGHLGSKTWEVSQNIVDALNTTYELALKSLVPTGKSILIGVDVSGSMTSGVVGGTAMNAAQLSGVLALTLLRSEPNAEVILFDTKTYAADFGRRNSIDEVLNKRRSGGGTDCGLPFAHALVYKQKYDAFVILTDSETWAGKSHGIQVLDQYRKSINPNVKVVEVALVSNPYTTLPTDDKNVVRTVGFDAGVIEVINKFLV